MLSFYIRLFVTTITVLISAKYIPGLMIKDLNNAIFFGLVLGVINAFIRPLITMLTIPINVFFLGLFSLLINAFTYWLAGELAFGVVITQVKGAVLGGGIIWIVSLISNLFIKEERI